MSDLSAAKHESTVCIALLLGAIAVTLLVLAIHDLKTYIVLRSVTGNTETTKKIAKSAITNAIGGTLAACGAIIAALGGTYALWS